MLPNQKIAILIGVVVLIVGGIVVTVLLSRKSSTHLPVSAPSPVYTPEIDSAPAHVYAPVPTTTPTSSGIYYLWSVYTKGYYNINNNTFSPSIEQATPMYWNNNNHILYSATDKTSGLWFHGYNTQLTPNAKGMVMNINGYSGFLYTVSQPSSANALPELNSPASVSTGSQYVWDNNMTNYYFALVPVE